MNRNLGVLFAMILALGMIGFGCSANNASPDVPNYKDDGNSNNDGPVLCSDKSQCKPDEDCVDGVCKAGSSCSCNYDCNKFNHEVCDQVGKKCVDGAPPVNCSKDCDCFANETCSGGACVPAGGDSPTCNVDGDCPANNTCVNHKCVPQTCTKREDCAGASCLICKNGACTAPPPVCQGNTDCCVKYHCNFGTCLPDATGCQSDSDCTDPANPHCNTQTGACQPECTIDADCAAGMKCISNHCKVPGCTVASCQQGQWCDTSDGTCKAGCDENSDCTAPQTCNYTTHLCGQTDCCGGQCTGTGQYCDTTSCTCANSCVGTNCVNGGCTSGYTCDTASNKCVLCPSTYQCDTTTGHCKCTSTTTCPSGKTCNLTTGQCEGGPTCTPACVPPQTCVNGTCVNQGTGKEGDPCTTDADCNSSANLLCNNSLFCIICYMGSTSFNPDYMCRTQCSFLTACTISGQTCTLARFYGSGGTLDLKSICQAPL